MPSSAFGREMRPITSIGVNRAGRYRTSSNVQLQGRYLAVVRTLLSLTDETFYTGLTPELSRNAQWRWRRGSVSVPR